MRFKKNLKICRLSVPKRLAAYTFILLILNWLTVTTTDKERNTLVGIVAYMLLIKACACSNFFVSDLMFSKKKLELIAIDIVLVTQNINFWLCYV